MENDGESYAFFDIRAYFNGRIACTGYSIGSTIENLLQIRCFNGSICSSILPTRYH